MKIILAGPKTEELGGTTVSFNYLIQSLSAEENIHIQVINTSIGKYKATRYALYPLFLIKLLCYSFTHDLITFHASNKKMLKSAYFLYIIKKVTKKPIVVRVFGGSLDKLYKQERFEKEFKYLFSLDKVLLQTKRLKDYFSKELKIDNIVWFPTSRPKVKFNYTQINNKHKIKLVYIGRISKDKGVDKIINYFNHSSNYKNIKIDLYGNIYDHELISNLPPEVKYCGIIKPDRIPKLLANHDALIFPTRYTGEGYPGVIIEALSVNTPVITSNWNDISELIEDNVNGFLIDPFSDNELNNLLLKLSLHPKILKNIRDQMKVSEFQFSSNKWNNEIFLKICKELTN